MVKNRHPVHRAYAIFIKTVCDGRIPAWHDVEGFPVVFPTEREAQREIADHLQLRLQEFLDGNREFEDAITIEDFILPVEVWPNGSISLEDGSTYGRKK